MPARYNVLFLCTGNRARSILAEAILKHRGRPSFAAHSAGSRPQGAAHPVALRMLTRAGISTEGLRSKSRDEFARPEAPKMDFVFTLCHSATRETCPVWLGQPLMAHWGVRDPGDAGDNTARQPGEAGNQERNRPHRARMKASLDDKQKPGGRVSRRRTSDAEPGYC